MGGAALRLIGLVLTASAAAAVAMPASGAPFPTCEVVECDPLQPHLQVGESTPPPQTTTDDIARDPSRRNFTAINFTTVRTLSGKPVPTAGIVGVDVTLGDDDTPAYQACFNVEDPYHGACSGSGVGYTMVKNWYAGGRTNFTRGLIIGNSSTKDACAAPCRHYWGQRAIRIDVELYAKLSSGLTDVGWVRPRFAQFANQFTSQANGGTYGPSVGPITLLRLGERGTASLEGTITRFGLPVRGREVALRLFQQDWSGRSAGGQRLQSFATPVSTDQGTFTTGALYSGRFFIRVIDSTTGECREMRNLMITSIGARFDLELSDAGFGHEMTPCP